MLYMSDAPGDVAVPRDPGTLREGVLIMTHNNSVNCPDCAGELNRRDFVRVAGTAAMAAGVAPLLSDRAAAAPSPGSAAETTAKLLYESLTDSQKKVICMPFNHKKRTTINPNWHITEPVIGDDFYTTEQRQLILDVLRGATSEDGYDKLQLQMDDDDGGSDNYSVALFGKPGTGKFEWVMTGRHLTIRADGDSAKNVAFGGPIVYGHGVEEPSANLFHYQTKKANEVFGALDTDQRKQALLKKAPKESAVPLQGKKGNFPGVAVGELSSDQKELVESVVKVILAPYRTEDVEEALAILKKGGGLESLHLAFYQDGDLNDDRVWDIWRVEGPSFVWHFRGAPHVHTYVNIGLKKNA